MNTRDWRFQYKSAMPHTQLSLQHTENARLLPDRGELLCRLPQGGVGAEIGAAFGDFTGEILEKNAPRELYLIDAWDTPRYQDGLQQIRMKYRGALENDRLRIVQGYSTVRLAEFPNSFFDWVYIDTNHSFETTWEELVISNSKVRPQGRIAGHDFCSGNVVDAVPYGVVEACTKFCKDFHWQFEYLTMESHGHFSFSLKRL
ncbi:class I SAM-dependent methyltransferase [Rhizobium sp. BR 315]|uniref:class I SAM-dependent methyltransferase n=1 Tax=Rhizobium sp. BR 315 TaxID=3040014 RepID=UPI003D34E6C3